MLMLALSTLLLVFLTFSRNLLLSLILLEIIRFVVLMRVCSLSCIVLWGDLIIVVLFSVFVIEGVIALTGIISLVSTSGSDYVRTARIVEC